VLTVAIWTFLQTPMYQPTAPVLIGPEPPKVLNIQDVTPIGAPTQDYYRTQYEIITSRPIVEKTIEALNLKQRVPDLARAADPIRAFQAGVTIEPKRNTRLVLVKFEHRDPALAAEITNALARQYAKYNLDLKLKGAQDALAWLTEQMSGLKNKVQESSVALQNYRVKSGIMGLQEQRQITAQKIMDFNKAYLEAQAERRRDQDPAARRADGVPRGQGARGDAARQRQPAAQGRTGAEREGDPVPRAAARVGLQPAALRGRPQASQGDGRDGRAGDEQRERDRGGAGAAGADPAAQDDQPRRQRAGRALRRRGRGAHDRVLRHHGEDPRRRGALPRADGHRHRAHVRREA